MDPPDFSRRRTRVFTGRCSSHHKIVSAQPHVSLSPHSTWRAGHRAPKLLADLFARERRQSHLWCFARAGNRASSSACHGKPRALGVTRHFFPLNFKDECGVARPAFSFVTLKVCISCRSDLHATLLTLNSTPLPRYEQSTEIKKLLISLKHVWKRKRRTRQEEGKEHFPLCQGRTSVPCRPCGPLLEEGRLLLPRWRRCPRLHGRRP